MAGGSTQLYLPDGQQVQLPVAPRTWVDEATGVPGDWLRAKWLNRDVGGAVAWHRQRPLFQGITSTGTNILTSAWTPMPMVEIIDNYQGHSDSANTSRWYAPNTSNTTDWYLVIGTIPMVSTNATVVHAAGFRVNGGTPFEGMMITSGAHNVAPMVVDLVQLAGGDYVELVGWQNTGATVVTVASPETPVLTVRWVCAGSGTTVALPNPHSWSPADLASATATGGAKVPLNREIRDLIRWLNFQPIARASSATTTQTIVSGTGYTSIAMPTMNVDNYGMWASANNSRLTCQRPGLHLIAGQASLVEINPAIGYRSCRLLQTLAAGGTVAYPGTSVTPPSASATGTHLVAVHPIRMATGDYVEMQVSHTQTANMTVKNGASNGSKLLAVWRSL